MNVNNFGNNINILKTENNYGNNSTIKNGVGNALNQGNNNLNNTVNIASIRQVRTAFNQNDGNNNSNQKTVNNNNSPKICIGPHWYLAIVSNILITLLVSSMYCFLIETTVFVSSKNNHIFKYFLTARQPPNIPTSIPRASNNKDM